MLTVKNVDAIQYYVDICEKNNLSKRQLQEKIKSKEYDRLSEKTKNKLIESKQLEVIDLVPNSIKIKNNFFNDKITEYALKQSILNNLDEFLSKFGSGFAYIGNEFKIKLDERYNYIDLLLFNIEYSCYVVVELKVTELKKEHIGQIQVYMNYIDNNLKKVSQNKTIGIIICKQDNKYVIEYCSDDSIFSREYELV